MADLARFIGDELAVELDGALGRIRHCLDQLTDEQIWQRPTPAMNSIANLMLHLAGNVRQYIISGIGGAADTRDRPLEFAERGPLPKAEVLAKLQATVDEAKAVLVAQSAAEWERVRRVQRYDYSGLRTALHSVAHFCGHAQEIIHQTRTMLGENYRFAFVPATNEKGAK